MITPGKQGSDRDRTICFVKGAEQLQKNNCVRVMFFFTKNTLRLVHAQVMYEKLCETKCDSRFDFL